MKYAECHCFITLTNGYFIVASDLGKDFVLKDTSIDGLPGWKSNAICRMGKRIVAIYRIFKQDNGQEGKDNNLTLGNAPVVRTKLFVEKLDQLL